GGTMRDLGTLGGLHSFGWAINAGGQVAGASWTTGMAEYHAFRYDGTPGAGGIMRDLGSLGGGTSEAHSINSAGYVCGFAYNVGPPSVNFATLWKPDLSIVNLDAWLNSVNPIEGPHWVLRDAEGINDAGFIVGEGDYNDGPGGLSDGTRAFV